MKKELINHHAHFWRNYRAVCEGFDRNSWKDLGFGLTQPDRLALHILQSTLFYIGGEMDLICPDGSAINSNCHDMEKTDLPEKEVVLGFLEDVENRTQAWINDSDLEAKNEKYPWTGETAFSVILFNLRHSQYHLGEMNGLLNEALEGKADDSFAKLL